MLCCSLLLANAVFTLVKHSESQHHWSNVILTHAHTETHAVNLCFVMSNLVSCCFTIRNLTVNNKHRKKLDFTKRSWLRNLYFWILWSTFLRFNLHILRQISIHCGSKRNPLWVQQSLTITLFKNYKQLHSSNNYKTARPIQNVQRRCLSHL